MKKRSRARELALQVLYSIEVSGESAAKALADMKREEQPDTETLEYAQRIVTAVTEHAEELDKAVKERLENWDLGRVAILDKNLLRMAIVEILHFEDIPPKVSIDEAIELAKRFSTEKSGQFINGILDPIAFKEKKPHGGQEKK